MNTDTPTRTLESLSNDEIESCINGSTNIDLVRRLLKENQAPDGWIWEMDFGAEFAEAIEGFIDADKNTDDWDDAWNVNCEWGEQIAENVNQLLAGE